MKHDFLDFKQEFAKELLSQRNKHLEELTSIKETHSDFKVEFAKELLSQRTKHMDELTSIKETPQQIQSPNSMLFSPN